METIDIIKIVIFGVQLLLYLIVFVKLHNLKSNKPLTLADIWNKAKTLFKTYIGTFNLNALIELLKTGITKKNEALTESEKEQGETNIDG